MRDWRTRARRVAAWERRKKPEKREVIEEVGSREGYY